MDGVGVGGCGVEGAGQGCSWWLGVEFGGLV